VSALPVAAQVYYIDSDHLNTPRVITDASNRIVWQWENSDPFGDNLPQEDPGNTGNRLEFNLRFPGQYFDKESGLHYNYYRTFDPGTGRYVESDPIGLRGGINTYAYVHGNPIRYFDPNGLKEVLIMKLRKSWMQLSIGHSMLGGDKQQNPGNTPENNAHEIYSSTEYGEVDDDCVLDQTTEQRYSGMGKWWQFRMQWLEVHLTLYSYKHTNCSAKCVPKNLRFVMKDTKWAGADDSWENLEYLEPR
jgi:RHS repeat-associated protein